MPPPRASEAAGRQQQGLEVLRRTGRVAWLGVTQVASNGLALTGQWAGMCSDV